jgi:hypothetical protein
MTTDITTDNDADKRQTRPLVREGNLHGQDKHCQTVSNISDGARHRDGLTDWLTDRRSQCDSDSGYILKNSSAPKHKQYTWWWPNKGLNMLCF